jgi:hypothetical protein
MVTVCRKLPNLIAPPAEGLSWQRTGFATEALMSRTGLALRVACLTPIFSHL